MSPAQRASLAALVMLSCSGSRGAAPETARPEVRVTGPGTVAVRPDSVFGRKLEVVTLRQETVAIPVFTVTGSVVAQLRPGNAAREDRWQFATAEAQAAWADWRRTHGERAFAGRQLAATRELADSRIKAQSAVVERLRKLVEMGTDSRKDLAQEEASLAQMRLEGQKDVYSAQAALAASTRSAMGLERQLLQAGVDPKLLEGAPEGAVIVMAEVPEARVASVRVGQACAVRFYGLPEVPFRGTVRSLGSALARDRRALPVLFDLSDREGRLRPGMFADIGLGTDTREALLVPAEAVLHVGRADYVFIAGDPGSFRAVSVKVGDAHEGRLQVLDGLKAGDRVVASGAILLKPYVASAPPG